ncbi:four-domain proteases inhibitor-like [Lucilia cuprina]|uniref:four-domain proteases inhibitor-like n=1 Tax=Lucilia cuprina TaxID=7375 RepID=UPI001F05B843|nr:four-domain proteases inhibitor-like [Lucilia cuprina]
MKFFSTIVYALFFICAVQAQRGFPGNRRGPGAVQGGGGPKSDCPTFCPLNYQPTCGFNGRCYKEFSNTCALNAAACLGEGNFRQVNIQECSKRGARTC